MAENPSISTSGPPINSSQSNLSDVSQTHAIVIDRDRIQLSKGRWVILFAISIFGFATALCSELSPILKPMTKLLNVGVHEYIYISQISYYLLVFIAMPIAWFVDKYGVRISIYLAAILMLARNGFRALLFYPDSPDWQHLRMFYFIVSNIIAVAAFTLFFCLPLKISELWFATSERSVAWTTMVSMFSLGASVGAFTFPRFIHQNLEGIELLSYLNIGCALIATPIILLCITKSQPTHPASERMLKSSLIDSNYMLSLKKMVRHKDIVIHITHGAIFEGMNLSISSLLQDLFAAVNKTEIFVGDLIATNALLSIIMLILLSISVHRASNPILTCKLASIAQTLTLALHIATMKYPMANWIVLILSFSFTVAKSWFIPNSTNMMAHLACGTVSQATISGFAMTITLVVGVVIQTVFVSSSVRITDDKRDYTASFVFALGLCLVNSLVYFFYFEGKAVKSSEEDQVQSSNDNQASQ